VSFTLNQHEHVMDPTDKGAANAARCDAEAGREADGGTMSEFPNRLIELPAKDGGVIKHTIPIITSYPLLTEHADVLYEADGRYHPPEDARAPKERKALNKREWLYIAVLWGGIILMFGSALMIDPHKAGSDVWAWLEVVGLVTIIGAGINSPHPDSAANKH
jgi:hypothetical protein